MNLRIRVEVIVEGSIHLLLLCLTVFKNSFLSELSTTNKPLPPVGMVILPQILPHVLQIKVSCNYFLFRLFLLLFLPIWRQLVNFETAREIISVLHCTLGRRMESHFFPYADKNLLISEGNDVTS